MQEPNEMEALDGCAEVHAAAAARVRPVDEPAARNLAVIFKALSDPTRLRIISILAECELCVNDLSQALGMTQSAVSHQLADMREKRLLAARRDGRHIYYRLDDEHVRHLFAEGLAHVRHTGNGALHG